MTLSGKACWELYKDHVEGGYFPKSPRTAVRREQGAGGPYMSPEVCEVSVAALSSHKDSVLLSALMASELCW